MEKEQERTIEGINSTPANLQPIIDLIEAYHLKTITGKHYESPKIRRSPQRQKQTDMQGEESKVP